MKKDDIVTVVTFAGDFVGKYVITDGSTITIKDPRMVIQSQQGMGFAKGICVTGEMDPTEVTFQSYVFVADTNDEIIKAWRQATSGLVTV